MIVFVAIAAALDVVQLIIMCKLLFPEEENGKEETRPSRKKRARIEKRENDLLSKIESFTGGVHEIDEENENE